MKKQKKYIIIGLCLVLMLMGVGYGLLSETLMINGSNTVEGKWNIHIVSITPTSKSASAVSRNVKVTNNGLSASFAVDLYEAGDYVEYTVQVKNDGNVNAVLENVDSSITNRSSFISMTNSLEQNNRIGEALNANQTMTFTVRIAVNGNENELEDVSGSIYKITLHFLQA